MRISEYLNVHKLTQHCQNGYVRAQKHRELPLVIYCYSRQTVLDQMWDDVTTRTRGLIVHSETGEIIARPFEKFFNIDTESQPQTMTYNLPGTQPIVTEKLDGNLAIYYRLGDYEGIASKGSFHSDHAEWGTRWYRLNVKPCWYDCGVWPWGYTPVFEQICEGIEHHVVHYGEGQQGLFLLALISNQTGEELSREELEPYLADVPGVADYNLSVGAVLSENRTNHEGYVLTWPAAGCPGRPPFRVKVKHEDFLRLQKIKNNATSKNILQALIEGRKDDVIHWASISDGHMEKRIRNAVEIFEDSYKTIFNRVSALVRLSLETCTTRKESVTLFNQPHNEWISGAAFAMLDQKPNYQRRIWRLVRERHKDALDEVETEEMV